MAVGTPEPGAFFVIKTWGEVSTLISIGERMIDGHGDWTHTGICSRIENGVVWIVEAEPGGAVERPWHYTNEKVAWSGGIIPSSPAVAERAVHYKGTEYGFGDYVVIAQHRYLPWLDIFTRPYADCVAHMICSQLVAQCFADAGIPLATGKRPAYVTPGDLGLLLSRKGSP